MQLISAQYQNRGGNAHDTLETKQSMLKTVVVVHFHPVLRIRKILVWIRLDPHLWLMDLDLDPTPDPVIFISDLHEGNKKFFFSFFAYYFLPCWESWSGSACFWASLSGSISQRCGSGSGSGSAPKCHGSPSLTFWRYIYIIFQVIKKS